MDDKILKKLHAHLGQIRASIRTCRAKLSVLDSQRHKLEQLINDIKKESQQE